MRSWKATCLGLTLLGAPVLAQQEVGKDVPPTHWAYGAVQDLGGKGLIKGYPPDNKFLGGRTLTRYEMASIIERVLARMDDLLSQKANKSDAAPGNAADIQKLQSSLSEINDLVEEFKKELLVTGADLKTAQTDIDALKQQVGALTDKVNSLDQRISDASTKAGQAATLADQALENLAEFKTQVNADLGHKIDVANGRLRIGATLQAWYIAAFGSNPNGANPQYSNPPGRQFGSNIGDTFRLKRMEIFFTGLVNPSLAGKGGAMDYFLLLDTAKTTSLSTTSTTVAGTSVLSAASAQPNSTLLQDAYIGVTLMPRWRFEIGQQKTDLDEEGSRSSAYLMTIERSIMNILPVADGRVGYVRDEGALVRFSNSYGKAMVGVWNGNGEDQTTTDGDRQKFADFNAYYTHIRNTTLGAWGGVNFGTSLPAAGKQRFGYTAIYQSGPHYLESEGAVARDYVGSSTGTPSKGSMSRGLYGLYGYAVARKWQLVGRYDIWDPAVRAANATGSSVTLADGTVIGATDHTLGEYTLGVNYYLYGKTSTGAFDPRAKILVNYIWEDPGHNGVSFWGVRRQMLITGFQAAF